MVLGSPGEEGGGGKVRLIDAGVLDGMDAAVMTHPAGFDAVSRTNLGRLSLEAVFHGRASHAAAAPEIGRNALDAVTVLLVAIGLLRQQVRTDSRIHARIAEGGQSINIIPELARAELFVRSPDHDYLRGRLYEAVRDCVQGAALATGTTAELTEPAPAYDPVLANPVLADLAAKTFTRARPAAQSRHRLVAAPRAPPTWATSANSCPRCTPISVRRPKRPCTPGSSSRRRRARAGTPRCSTGPPCSPRLLTALFTGPELLDAARESFRAARG